MPVFYRNERNFTYTLPRSSEANVENNYLAYCNITPKEHHDKDVNGFEMNHPYAGAYLLTSILSSDYIDRTFDGPTNDDFGGFTKFNYKVTAGLVTQVEDESKDQWSDRYAYSEEDDNNHKFYKWRTPYSGLNYSKNTLIDPNDNTGSFSMGEKEIFFLESIETKTHKAYFITNKSKVVITTPSGTVSLKGCDEERMDGFEANHNEYQSSGNTEEDLSDKTNKLEYLQKIVLFARDINDPDVMTKEIQTVHFDYSWDLCEGMPNSIKEEGDRVGKLTLEKVWFEHNGIRNARISPYRFLYTYKDETSDYTYPEKYSDLDMGQTMLDATPEVPQNPDYNHFNTDRWGYYQKDGADRFDKQITWVDQTPSSQFDPAAWNLKRIILPSGGEIHVQYEQHDYRYVQDRDALSMVSLSDFGTDDDDNEWVKLKVQDDLDLNSTEIDDLIIMLRQKFINNDEKIYFKYLYSMSIAHNPNLDNCLSEYIDGFAKVKKVERSGNEIKITLVDDPGYQICKNYYHANCSGKIDPHNGCDSRFFKTQADSRSGELEKFVKSIISKQWPVFSSYCVEINPELSYLRIPSPKAKKGGGIRVKRLLYYDRFNLDFENQSTPTAEASLYGKEYFYIDKNGKSSGVASNEPAMGKEENALVTLWNKAEAKSGWKEFWSGKDLKQYRGPIGESILPAPSIGYSNVIIRDIHTGSTNSGLLVKEFHTTKDYPFDGYYKPNERTKIKALQHSNITKDNPLGAWNHFSTGLFDKKSNNVYASQGYLFIQNNMNGQPKSVTTYAGTDLNNYGLLAVGSQEIFEYFQPTEKIPMMYGINDIRQEYPGRESELIFESKKVEDITTFANANIDLTCGLAFFFPIPWVCMSVGILSDEKNLSTHVTTKTIKYPAILKRSISIQDGLKNTTENIAFDPYSGRPIVKRTTDGFDELNLASSSDHDGAYYNYSFPASHEYPSLGQQSKNIKSRFVGIKLYYEDEILLLFEEEIGDESSCEMSEKVSPGDLLRLDVHSFPLNRSSYGLDGYYNVVSSNRNSAIIKPVFEGISQTSSGFFLAEVIKSGAKNALADQTGSLITYGQTGSEFSDITYGKKKDFYEKTTYLPNEATENSVSAADLVGRDLIVATLNDNVSFAYDIISQTSATSTTFMLNEFFDEDFILDNGNCSNSSLSFSIRNFDVNIYNKIKSFDLCIDGGSSRTITVTEDSHPLVSDLNNWLDSTWSMRLDQKFENFEQPLNTGFYNVDNFYDLYYVFEKGSSSYTCDLTDTSYSQKYVTHCVDDHLEDSIDVFTGLDRILNRTYNICGENITGDSILYHKDCKLPASVLINRQDSIIHVAGSMIAFKHQMNFDTECSSTHTPFYTSDYWWGIRSQTQPYNMSCYCYNIAPCDSNCACANCIDGRNYCILDYKPWFTEKNYDAWFTLPGADSSEGFITVSSSTFEDLNNDSLFKHRANVFTETYGKFRNDSEGWLYYDRFGNDYYGSDDTNRIMRLYDTLIESTMFDCCITVHLDNFSSTTTRPWRIFGLSGDLGHQIVLEEDGYIDNGSVSSCNNYTCLTFCDDLYPTYSFDGVISTSAQSYTDRWEYELSDFSKSYSGKNEFQEGKMGKWRQAGDFVYKTTITDGAGVSTNRIYDDAGVFSDFTLFNWKKPSQNSSKWLRTNTITMYSPDGNAVEEKNILDIYSCARFGYKQSVPILIAKNAKFNSVFFESYEDKEGVVTGIAHSGDNSKFITSMPGIEEEETISDLKINEQIFNEGLILKVWAKPAYDNMPISSSELDYLNADIYTDAGVISNTTGNTSTFTKIAQTGEWYLFSISLKSDKFAGHLDETLTIEIFPEIGLPPNTDSIWIDDIRIQPLNAEMLAYVYDASTLKLLAQFDDQHFGLYYQYNAEGKLIRKLRETERGLKTIAEAQYNTPKIAKTVYKPEDEPIPPLVYSKYFGNVSWPSWKWKSEINKQLVSGSNEKSGIESIFDILKVNISPDKQQIDFFGLDKNQLKELDSSSRKLLRYFDPSKLDTIDFENRNVEFNNGMIDSIRKDVDNIKQRDLDPIKGKVQEKINKERNKLNQKPEIMNKEMKDINLNPNDIQLNPTDIINYDSTKIIIDKDKLIKGGKKELLKDREIKKSKKIRK